MLVVNAIESSLTGAATGAAMAEVQSMKTSSARKSNMSDALGRRLEPLFSKQWTEVTHCAMCD